MTVRNNNIVAQSMTRDIEGHREYTVTWHIVTSTPLHGPEIILASGILPAVGSPYSIDDDYDPWAFCTPELTIAPHRNAPDGEPTVDWYVTQKFSTKTTWRCQTFPIDNPLLEPYEISGDFTHEQREPSKDKDNKPLLFPNFQPITGPKIEQKYSYPTISIKFNSATLPLSTYVLLINRVNDSPLWGMPARCVRFIDAKWERKLYGVCYYYFTTTYTFEFNLDTFDPKIPAVGTKYLRNGGDPSNPDDFIQKEDATGHSVEVLLNARGEPIDKIEDQYIAQPQIAKEGNLLLLGIPATIP